MPALSPNDRPARPVGASPTALTTVWRLGALVEERDGGEVEVADLARRFERGGVDVLGGERAVEARQRGEEALVLVLGALDGGEDALGLDAAQHLLGGALQERLFALGERACRRSGAIGAQDAAQVAVFHDRHAEER